ncbi:hypothetical protein OQJ13_02610 [Legionella sp. PATHC035]|uniref:hypothetical protein n=1 Tax=Legionella sp. PATHC035 TaxID=2992040 RepID=UPI0022443A2B|nr:hypothetical protein [Legionella sp. PATHC035]MCW8407859.1 hypothetical protein [Legionella sp. PATHC035]
MKIKSLATVLALAASMTLANVPNQPVCYKEFHEEKGWHMVSKKCHIPPARNWREYNSGYYTRPEL